MGLTKSSGCTTTAYALSPKGALDTYPGYYIPIGCFQMRLAIINQEPDLHQGIARTWKRVLDKLAPKEGRCNKVVSLFASVIAYILDFGWTVTTARLWTSPSRRLFHIRPGPRSEQE
eukprot:6937734-Pyramimonas_sp.AAC.1